MNRNFIFQLNQLKTDLRDVLYSHKWTPDAYLLAKAYIAEDDEKEAAQEGRLPKITLKPPNRKLYVVLQAAEIGSVIVAIYFMCV